MLRSVPMELFNLAILDEDLDKVTELIVRQGVLHLVKINELQAWARDLESAKTAGEANRYLEAEK